MPADLQSPDSVRSTSVHFHFPGRSKENGTSSSHQLPLVSMRWATSWLQNRPALVHASPVCGLPQLRRKPGTARRVLYSAARTLRAHTARPPMGEDTACALPVTAPLVGRERELAALRDALVSALDGRGSLVLIGG